MQTVFTAHPPSHLRLVLDSFDSAEECSLTHWIEVCQLVDEGEAPGAMNDTAVLPDLEPAAWN